MLSFTEFLIDARRTLLSMVEQLFLPVGEVWSMHNTDTQCALWGERRPKGKEDFLCLNFSYLAIKYEFYVTVSWHCQQFL